MRDISTNHTLLSELVAQGYLTTTLALFATKRGYDIPT